MYTSCTAFEPNGMKCIARNSSFSRSKKSETDHAGSHANPLRSRANSLEDHRESAPLCSISRNSSRSSKWCPVWCRARKWHCCGPRWPSLSHVQARFTTLDNLPSLFWCPRRRIGPSRSANRETDNRVLLASRDRRGCREDVAAARLLLSSYLDHVGFPSWLSASLPVGVRPSPILGGIIWWGTGSNLEQRQWLHRVNLVELRHGECGRNCLKLSRRK